MRMFLLCVVLVYCINVVEMMNMISIFKLCDREDPEIDDCLKDAIQNAIKTLSPGLPGLKLRSLDPYIEQELVIEYRRNQISGKAVLKDIRSYGMSKAKVHAVRSNIQDDSFDLEIDMSNKEITVDGFVKGEGRLNALVFSSKGFFNNTMSDVTWTYKLSGKPEVKNGKTYMRIVKFFMRPEVGNMKVHIPNIFGDNAELNKIAYEFSNNNWRLIYGELLPIVEIVWAKIGTGFANKIFLKVPYNELFPSSATP